MTKKQKRMLWRIIATAVIILVIKLFSIGGIAGTLLYLAAYGSSAMISVIPENGNRIL